MEWPKPGDVLFRSDAPVHLNACINFYHPTLGTAAHCYKTGADALAHAAANGDAVLDAAILPIVFLYRHYLELMLKDIIDTARRIEQEEPGYPITHNLKDLWTEVVRLIRKHYQQDAPQETIDHIQPCIDEFDSHDPLSIAFRYPTDKKGKANLRDISHINLNTFYETMERLGSFLDCIATDLGQKLQYMYEAQYDSY